MQNPSNTFDFVNKWTQHEKSVMGIRLAANIPPIPNIISFCTMTQFAIRKYGSESIVRQKSSGWKRPFPWQLQPRHQGVTTYFNCSRERRLYIRYSLTYTYHNTHVSHRVSRKTYVILNQV